jgi:hypothetical protein
MESDRIVELLFNSTYINGKTTSKNGFLTAWIVLNGKLAGIQVLIA